MHSVGRKIALYFVAPFGLAANAISYPQHKSEACSGAVYVDIVVYRESVYASTSPAEFSGVDTSSIGSCTLASMVFDGKTPAYLRKS